MTSITHDYTCDFHIFASQEGDLSVWITCYLQASPQTLAVRWPWLFLYRLFISACYFSLPSGYLPFCHLSSPLEAVQVHGEEGKLTLIFMADLGNAALREAGATLPWHLYYLWISWSPPATKLNTSKLHTTRFFWYFFSNLNI